MDTITEETPPLATTACTGCGQSVFYEPILLFGHDLARSLHLHCDDCQKRLDEERERDERERLRLERMALVSALLPPDLLATDTAHPHFNAALWQVVGHWRPTMDEFWLGIVGPAGRCKTRCLAMRARRAIMGGIRVVWTTANRLLEAAHDRNNRDNVVAKNAREHLADCLHAGWLVIDDLGKNEWTSAFESQFFQILDHRKNHRLPILFSSNAHPEAFALVISDLNREPIIGRLCERVTLLEVKR